MKKIFTLLLVLLPAISFSTTYRTLASGAWSNTTNVWSINGSTPCLCAPPTNLSGDTIIMNHIISLANNLTLSSSASVIMGVNSRLNASGMTVDLTKAQIVSNGTIVMKKLTIDEKSAFTINSTNLEIEFRLEVSGKLIINNAILQVNLGNVTIYDVGLFDLANAAKLNFISGNFSNFGLTNICPDCCLELAGNVRNEPGGTVTGSGGLISLNGNIRNQGVWDSNINYCTPGNDTGMPSGESCMMANTICAAFTVLPVELVAFKGEAKEGYNELKWTTASELNCDYFEVQRSMDCKEWSSLGEVKGAGNSTQLSDYLFRDVIPTKGIAFYRLVQYDYDGSKDHSQIVSILTKKIDGISLFPNPNKNHFILASSDLSISDISIYDMNGSKVYTQKWDDYKPVIEIQHNLNPGMYIININENNQANQVKLFVD